ncbi:hypothetical protein ACFVTP_32505 [Streptomyces celluloflavus]|uniref:hypothetical protein n=1 Tax=Streptomyces celluloflavus TaxID=58344 RepID=UPI0036DBD72D
MVRGNARLACWQIQGRARSWYEAAVDHADLRSPHFSANHRQHVAKTLTAATIALSERPVRCTEPREARTALRDDGFNRLRRAIAPRAVEAVLEEAARHSPGAGVGNDPAVVRRVLAALSVKLDGSPAAPSALKRHR